MCLVTQALIFGKLNLDDFANFAGLWIHHPSNEFLPSKYLLQDGVLCGEDGQMDCVQFETAMRLQLRQFACRQLSDFLLTGLSSQADRVQAQMLKLLLSESLTADRLQKKQVIYHLDSCTDF